jgi:hypothetical protein
LAWLAVIGVDLLLGAGLLARFLVWQHPCLLPPIKAFQYIPLGYAVFLLWTILVLWLSIRVGVSGFRSGALFAAKLGVVVSGAGSLGMASMLTLPPPVLLVFFADGFAVFCVAGAVVGAGLGASRLRPLALRVGAFFLVCVVVTVALQSLGLAPAGEVRR